MKRKTVVVNMFAGPGAGKTTAAWEIASELKKRGYITEYVPEYAKELVWDKKFDLLDGMPEHQAILLEEQAHRLERLDGQVDFIVTDSPILLNPQYLKASNRVKEAYQQRVYEMFSRYTNFCVVIQRGDDFEQSGRIHNLEESIRLDQEIKDTLDHYKIYYGTYTHKNVPKIANNCIVTYNRVNREENKEKEEKPPTLEEKRIALLDKAIAEQGVYADWLKQQPSEEIMNHAYEYATRQDILMSFEGNIDALEEQQVTALLAMPDTMSDIFTEYRKAPLYMEDIADIIFSRASEKANELYPPDPEASIPLPTLDEMKGEIQNFMNAHWEEEQGQAIYKKVSQTDGADYGAVSKLYDEVQQLKRQSPDRQSPNRPSLEQTAAPQVNAEPNRSGEER